MGGNLSHNADELRRAKEGDRLRFRRKWFYSHYGVYIGNEELIHLDGIEDDGSSACNSNPMHVFTICGQRFNKAEVRKDNVWNVIKGSKVYIDNEKDEEKTPRSPSEIVKKASSMIGPIKYNVLYNNCEHFATFCRYDVKESEQIRKGVRGMENKGVGYRGIFYNSVYQLTSATVLGNAGTGHPRLYLHAKVQVKISEQGFPDYYLYIKLNVLE